MKTQGVVDDPRRMLNDQDKGCRATILPCGASLLLSNTKQARLGSPLSFL